LWTKLLLLAGVLLMLVSGGIIIGGKVLINKATKEIEVVPLLPQEVRAEGRSIDGALNILMLGMDERNGVNDPIRTDTMIIAHIPASHDTVYLISLVRDWKVKIPAYPPSGFDGDSVAKLTEAFAHGNTLNGRPDLSEAGRRRGVELLAKTVSGIVPGGIRFNAVALIDFDGFEQLVQVLGGVDMCVDEQTTSLHYNSDGVYVSDNHKSSEKMKVYKKGCYHLKPWEALDYVRQRKGLDHGDYDRQRHQQQFLFAIFRKLTSKQVLTDVGKVRDLTKAAGKLFTLDLNGVPLEDWLFSFKHIGAEDIQLIQQNAGKVNGQKINGVSYEIVTQTNVDLLKAVQQDKVYNFLTRHPDWLVRTAT
jgi:LCP family protein required for cell wall assembly